MTTNLERPVTAKDLPTLNVAVNKLMVLLATKQDELRRRETSCGTYHDVRQMNRLRQEIASLDKRLTRAERLQDAALVAHLPVTPPGRPGLEVGDDCR